MMIPLTSLVLLARKSPFVDDMDKETALEKLQRLVGQDLRSVAEEHGITVWKNGKQNKGWAGNTIERYLGIPLNSSRSPNLGTWELKVVPLKRDRNGQNVVKETMAITMLDPIEVLRNRFEESHLFTKLRKILAVARTDVSNNHAESICRFVHAFDLQETDLMGTVAADYQLIRDTITGEGFAALSGHMGMYIQPRTKGAGHGTTSRAFYARKQMVEYIIGMKASPMITYHEPGLYEEEQRSLGLVAETQTPLE